MVVLTLIGVISVFTIPGLMQNTHSAQTKAKVKKAYNTISQALEICYHGKPNFSSGTTDAQISLFNCLANKLNVKYYRLSNNDWTGWEDKTYSLPSPITFQYTEHAFIFTNDGMWIHPLRIADVNCTDALTINSKTSSQEAYANSCARVVVDVIGDTKFDSGDEADYPCSTDEATVDLSKLKCTRFNFYVDERGSITAGNPESTIVGRILGE